MRILVIDEVHDFLVEGLKELNHQVDYRPEISRDEMISIIPGYHGLVVRTKTKIDQSVLSQGTGLKFIARAGAGLDNIDTDWCNAHGIICFNAGEANADAVGEHAAGMLLGLMSMIRKSDHEVRKRIWDRKGNTGLELKNRTVGIIGYGNTGKAFASKLSGFGVKVLAYDKYLEKYSDAFVAEASLNEIQASCDILSFHVPLTEETHFMGNSEFFGNMQKPFFLLNLSRGKVVKISSVIDGLENGKILGAGLDVLENEDFTHLSIEENRELEYLIRSEKTVLTPHIGGWTQESYFKISAVLLQKIKELGEC